MTPFYLTVVCVNWGRGYRPGEFKRNVMNVMRHVDGREHVIIGVQELDEEPDLGKEHAVLGSMLEPGTKKVWWRTHEPIILSPSFRADRRRRVMTMGSGQDIGAPPGTGPRRYSISCVAKHKGCRVGVGNTHPHRRTGHPKVTKARVEGLEVFGAEMLGVQRSGGGTSGIWMGDMNDDDIPRLVPYEKVAKQKGLDHIRYWNHPDGDRLTLLDTGSLNGTIDPHDPLWARFMVTKRGRR